MGNRLLNSVAFAALVVLMIGTRAARAEEVAPSIRLSSNGEYLIDADGQPVFLNGDSGWSLLVQPTNSEILEYLDDRKAKGVNIVIAELIEHKFAAAAPANTAGEKPFIGVPFATPNEAYFARADWIVDQAAQRGITLLLAPIYLGYDCGDEGWCAEVQQTSDDVMRDYGEYVGRRYGRFPNIVWMIGGDTNPYKHGVAGKLEAFVAGVKEYDTVHLMTAHTAPEESAEDTWGTPSWLNLNTVYTYSMSGTQAKTYTEYHRSNALPLFLLETAYEHEHGSTPLSLRTQAYQAVLWGARLGHFFGNCPLWSFSAPSSSSFCTSVNWKDELNSAGSRTVAYIGDLMRSRRHWLLEPDHAHAVMTAGYGSGSSLAVTARAADGSSVIAYLPTQREVTIDTAKIAGSTAHGWWWSPETKDVIDLGTFPTTGSRQFMSPTKSDWILVIDDASANLPPPGTPLSLPAPLPPLALRAN
jgi:hypothetical protein